MHVQDDVLYNARRCTATTLNVRLIWWLLVCQALHYFNIQDQRIPKIVEALSYSAVHEICKGGPFLYLAFQGGRRAPLPSPVSYATAYSSAGLTIVANVAIATGPAVFYTKFYLLHYM